ncbi:membrane protein YdbS with pleckstrin-like domain [Paraburkholderia sp. GAS199]
MIRAERNRGLPRGIRLIGKEYVVRGTKVVPGQHVRRADGSYGPVLKRITLGRVSSLAAAIRMREDFVSAQETRNVE